jgi:hypothetical protein
VVGTFIRDAPESMSASPPVGGCADTTVIRATLL